MITVFYSCQSCGLAKVPCEVEDRTIEPVTVWMQILGYTLQADHHRRSPECHACEAQDVMIPIAFAGKIGGESLQ